LLSTNFNVGGADFAGIREMEDLFKDAASKCPNSILLGGGYRHVPKFKKTKKLERS
jgi:cutinase